MSVDRNWGRSNWWISHFEGSRRKHRPKKDDYGSLDDSCALGSACHRRILHCPGHHRICSRGRGVGGPHGWERPQSDSRFARLPVGDDGKDGALQIMWLVLARCSGAFGLRTSCGQRPNMLWPQWRRIGLKVILLSGDSQAAATRVGSDLGVDEAIGDLLPHQKASRVSRKASRKAKCCHAWGRHQRCHFSSGGQRRNCDGFRHRCRTRECRRNSDRERSVEICRNPENARRCRRIIRQNFVGTLAVDSVGVGMAAFGMLNPLLAAFIHVASELTFIFNSTRLLRGAR